MINIIEFYDNVEMEFKEEREKDKMYVFECYNQENTFKINKLWIKYIKKDKFILMSHFTYNPLKTSEQSILYYDIPLELIKVKDILDCVFEILWKYKMCNECYYLIKENNSICEYCFMSKYKWEYGLSKNYIDVIPTCTICLEHVFKARLNCGHYFHKTCLIKMNPNSTYDNEEIKCPLCRELITKQDKIEYFLV